MDEIDKKIIEHLQQDASTPLSKIADLIGIPKPTAYLRFRKMREQGIIRGFRLQMGYSAGELHAAIVRVKHYLLSAMGERSIANLGKKFSTRQDVVFAAKFSPDSLIVFWTGDDLKITSFEEVASCEYVPALIFKE
ncbi:MAG TPA: Lrp/AsnC family transcriptional regulator [Candidatus Micrarchaeota archaeon]|nr:Lrp/AsnC family transcriptional regulator [Candidatus Micrarchaeota archaeon]